MSRIKDFHAWPGLALLLFFLVSCSSGSKFVRDAASIDSDSLSIAIQGRTAENTPEYRLGFGDVIEIKFFNNDQFNETVAVRPDGRISMERIGELYVNGMTPASLDSIITDRYAEVIKSPEITVILREFGGYQVYVLGEVNRAGGYAVQRDMTLLQAIASAGGINNSAKLKNVMLLRRNHQGSVEAIKVDLSRPLDGMTANDLFVQPQDIIFIPKTFIASASTFLSQVYDGLLPPVDSYMRAILAYSRFRDF